MIAVRLKSAVASSLPFPLPDTYHLHCLCVCGMCDRVMCVTMRPNCK